MKIIIIAAIVILGIIILVAKNRKSPNEQANSDDTGKIKLTPIVLHRQLSFTSDIVAYFKALTLDPKKDTPFIINMGQSEAKTQIGQLAATLTKGVPTTEFSLFEGVYREETNTISNFRLLVADSFDEQTKEVLTKATDGLIVLS